jgi:hypothetical protein
LAGRRPAVGFPAVGSLRRRGNVVVSFPRLFTLNVSDIKSIVP